MQTRVKKNSYLTVTDLFCGAGGSSQGARNAGAEVKIAANHWKQAIETHNTNFPDTDHLLCDISAVDFRRWRGTDILIGSPECTNHALAKGRKRKYQQQMDMFGTNYVDLDPSEERSRATMWDIPRYCEIHYPEAVITENVVEAALYWPTYNAWLQAMHDLGYEHQEVCFNSMFAHPTPQSRDRLYIVFWRKGNKVPNLKIKPKAWCAKCSVDVAAVQSWKKPKSRKIGVYNEQYVYRCPKCAAVVTPYYHAAYNIIDWSIPTVPIKDRHNHKLRPLAENTMNRIRAGFKKFWGRTHPLIPYLMNLDQQKGSGTHRTLAEPSLTQTTAQTTSLVVPYIIQFTREAGRSTDLSDWLQTITTRQDMALVDPFIVHLQNNSTPDGLEKAIATILSSGNHHGIVLPFIASQYTRRPGNEAISSIDKPLPTVPGIDIHRVVVPPFVTSYDATNSGDGIEDPLTTVTTLSRHGLVQPELGDAELEEMIQNSGFRMLRAKEVGKAMAFADDYVVLGNEREQVKQYGNAVTPPVMEMLFQRVAETLR